MIAHATGRVSCSSTATWGTTNAMPAVAAGSLVLVTGASGFIAAYVQRKKCQVELMVTPAIPFRRCSMQASL